MSKTTRHPPTGHQTALARVPASTSNLGSGFDTLGLAVGLHTLMRLTLRGERGVQVHSEAAEADLLAAKAMIKEAVGAFCARTGKNASGAAVRLSGNVPVARGLGASAAVRVGVLVCLNLLTAAGLSRQDLLELATDLEGHPDNASPALFGGFTVSGRVGRSVRCLRFPVSPKLKLVVLVPRFAVKTEAARRIMPASYPRSAAAHALNRTGLITAALATGRYRDLKGVFDDLFHQPYRKRLVPQLPAVVQAGVAAGALGGFLSGSGSAIICLSLAGAEAIARAMQSEMPESVVLTLGPENKGASARLVRVGP